MAVQDIPVRFQTLEEMEPERSSQALQHPAGEDILDTELPALQHWADSVAVEVALMPL